MVLLAGSGLLLALCGERQQVSAEQRERESEVWSLGKGFLIGLWGGEGGQVWDVAGVEGREVGSCISTEAGSASADNLAAGNGILFLESASCPERKGLSTADVSSLARGLPKRKTVLVRLHVCLFSGGL